MGNAEMIACITELQELKRMREDLDSEIETVSDRIKAAMGDAETATFGHFRVTYKEVVQSRLDSAALKRELPDIAARFSKTVTSRPLRVA